MKLLMVERMVLESLNEKEQNLIELERNTGLTSQLVQNITRGLIKMDVIVENDGHFGLNFEKRSEWANSFNHQHSLKKEAKEIFTNLVNVFFKREKKEEEINLKKVYMSSEEKMVFDFHISKLEQFVESLSLNRRPDNSIAEKKVVYWGVADYGQLVKESLSAI